MGLIYITDIINHETGEKVSIFMDEASGYKFLFKENELYEDSELLRKLHQEELSMKKSSFKTLIAVEGAICTFAFSLLGFTLAKEMSRSNMNYVLKKEVPGYEVVHTVDYNRMDQFLKEYERNLTINPYYNEEEIRVLKAGGEDFLNDWGYLYSPEDREEFLYGIRSFQIDREVGLDSPVVGTYYQGKIQIGVGHKKVLTTTHEVIHGIMRHSSKKHNHLSHGFGRSIDEAVTANLNRHYFQYYTNDEEEDSYELPRKMLFKLSLLLDPETIMKSQMLNENSVYELVCKACPHVSKEDITRFFTLLDAGTVVDGLKKYHVDENFELELDALYQKVYYDRFGKEFPKDVLITSDDFLSGKVEFYKKDYPCVYEVPREMFSNISDFDAIDTDFVTGYVVSNYSPLLLLCTEKEKDPFQRDYECVDYLFNKYLKKGKKKLAEYMNCLILEEKNFLSYFDLYVDCLNERNLSPREFISSLHLGIETFFGHCMEENVVDRKAHYREMGMLLKEKASLEVFDRFHSCFDQNLEYMGDVKIKGYSK